MDNESKRNIIMPKVSEFQERLHQQIFTKTNNGIYNFALHSFLGDLGGNCRAMRLVVQLWLLPDDDRSV